MIVCTERKNNLLGFIVLFQIVTFEIAETIRIAEIPQNLIYIGIVDGILHRVMMTAIFGGKGIVITPIDSLDSVDQSRIALFQACVNVEG